MDIQTTSTMNRNKNCRKTKTKKGKERGNIRMVIRWYINHNNKDDPFHSRSSCMKRKYEIIQERRKLNNQWKYKRESDKEEKSTTNPTRETIPPICWVLLLGRNLITIDLLLDLPPFLSCPSDRAHHEEFTKSAATKQHQVTKKIYLGLYELQP